MEGDTQNSKGAKIVSIEDIALLRSSLDKFLSSSTATFCWSLILEPNQDLVDIRDKLLRDKINLSKSQNDSFQKKAVDWVLKKFDADMTVPKTGLAVFAGVQKKGEDNEDNDVTRIWIPIYPEFTINATTYVWDTEFHPEILHANLDLACSFGIVILGGFTISLGCWNSKNSHVIHTHYSIEDGSDRESEKEKLKMLSDDYFNPDNSILIGTIFGVVLDGNAAKPGSLSHLLSDKLNSLPSIVLQVQQAGIDGIKAAIISAADFRDEAFFTAQKRMIDNNHVIPSIENPPQIEDLLNAWHAGSIELLKYHDNGLLVSKIQRQFEKLGIV